MQIHWQFFPDQEFPILSFSCFLVLDFFTIFQLPDFCMRVIPVTSAQIHAAMTIGIPIMIIERKLPTTVRTSCHTPIFILPAINVPSPGRIRLTTSATIAISWSTFLFLGDFLTATGSCFFISTFFVKGFLVVVFFTGFFVPNGYIFTLFAFSIK